MLQSFKAIDLTREATAVIQDNPAILEELNRKQLRKGKGRDGSYALRYVDDPYFKSAGAAMRYAGWKQSLGLSDPEKPFDVADFYINGYTHSEISARVSGNSVIFDAAVPWGSSIEQKTRNTAFGLTDESKAEFRAETLLPAMILSIKAKTGAT